LHAVVSVALLGAVLVLVVWQPRGLSIGWPTTVGAGIALALGLVRPADVAHVAALVWDATLAFVGIVLIATVLDEIGLFRWAALVAARAAGGRGRVLFVFAVLLGAAVAALFANDGAALILTPIVYEQAKALDLRAEAVLAFVFAGGLVADTTSIPFVLSNLVNILSADYFHLGFASYAARMLPVDMVALAATLAVAYAAYARVVPRRVPIDHLPAPSAAIADPWLFRRVWWLIALLMAGYLASEPLGVPISFVTTAGAVALALLARGRPGVDLRRAVAEAPWRIVVFSVGLYVLVFALRDAGLTRLLGSLFARAATHGLTVAVFATGLSGAILSSLVNNLPAVLVGALSVHDAHLPAVATRALAYANVIGTDLGTKFTPIGSLATLLWLHVLERRGLRISWRYFMRMGALLGAPVLFVTLAALAASFALAR
jgi:arsenical pump membrane protein